MGWEALTREELDELIAEGLATADEPVCRAWERIRIEPQKWQCSPWGDEGGGFWAVAIVDREVVWYNDIEHGFNTSPFSTWGIIAGYRCNQNEFLEYLLGLPEAQAMEGWALSSPNRAVPTEAQGSGEIVRRQTTYWDVQIADRGEWRIHFSGKAECRFVDARFEHIEIADSHVLLADHRDPWQRVYFTGTPADSEKLLAELDQQVKAATAGWRDVHDYLNRGLNLMSGYGLLMRAPEHVALTVASVLRDFGISVSTLPSRVISKDCRVLLLGRNFVIASAFSFERLATRTIMRP